MPIVPREQLAVILEVHSHDYAPIAQELGARVERWKDRTFAEAYRHARDRLTPEQVDAWLQAITADASRAIADALLQAPPDEAERILAATSRDLVLAIAARAAST